MIIGQTYKIKVEVSETGLDLKPKYKFIRAILVKEFKYYYLFRTKNYKTTIHKRDMNLIREVV